LTELARRLRADARGVALRFAGWFACLTLLWVVLSPAYAAVLSGAAQAIAPLIDPGTRYETEGPKIVAVRPIDGSPDGRPRSARQGLWSAAVTWNTAFLAAAFLATPGWTWQRRWRAVAIGVAALGGLHLTHLLVNAAYTRTRLPGVEPGSGALVLEWLTGFFDIVLAAVVPVALYLVLAASGVRAHAATAAVERNAPCPCGSGLKYKRCCGA
jgi:hypothetical protein